MRLARGRRERGHIVVMFAVSMLFTAALVFFVIGAGKRYLQKETVQGAVDATAFAAAVAEAKTFNTVAFLNLVLAVGVAIVYTLDAIMGGIIGFIITVGGFIAASLGTYCIGDPESCAYIAGPAEALAVRYQEAADDLTARLQPLARATAQVAKMGPYLVTASAEETGMHEAYRKREPGLVVLLKPLVERLPIQEGPANTVCGPAALAAENGAALVAEGLLRLPAEVPPTSRGIISAETLLAEAAAGAIVCEEGTTKLHPQELTPEWRKQIKIAAVAVLTDSRPGDRRAYLQAAASEYGPAPAASSTTMLATATASVYGFDGEKSEDLWHMDWRARLTLSTPADFDIPLSAELKSLWVH
jgi:hypothetical protein